MARVILQMSNGLLRLGRGIDRVYTSMFPAHCISHPPKPSNSGVHSDEDVLRQDWQKLCNDMQTVCKDMKEASKRVF